MSDETDFYIRHTNDITDHINLNHGHGAGPRNDPRCSSSRYFHNCIKVCPNDDLQAALSVLLVMGYGAAAQKYDILTKEGEQVCLVLYPIHCTSAF